MVKSRSSAFVLSRSSTYTAAASAGSSVRSFQAVVGSSTGTGTPQLVPITFSSNPLATTVYDPADHHQLHSLNANASVAVMGNKVYDYNAYTGDNLYDDGFFLVPDVDTGVGYDLRLPPGESWTWNSRVRLNAAGDRLFVLHDDDADDDLELHIAPVPRDGQLTDLDPVTQVSDLLPENHDFRELWATHREGQTTLFFSYSLEDTEGDNLRDQLLVWTEGDASATFYDLSVLVAEGLGGGLAAEGVSVDFIVSADGSTLVGDYYLAGTDRPKPFCYSFAEGLATLPSLPPASQISAIYPSTDGQQIVLWVQSNGLPDRWIHWQPFDAATPNTHDLPYADSEEAALGLMALLGGEPQPGGFLRLRQPASDPSPDTLRYLVPGTGELRTLYPSLFERYNVPWTEARQEHTDSVYLTPDQRYLVADVLTTQWPWRLKLHAARTEVLAAFPTLPAQQADGWNKSPWLGWFFADRFPWVWAPPHGWLWSGGSGPNHWFLDSGLGWIYTGETFYPWIWQDETSRWIFNDKGRRWYFDPQRLAGEQWYHVPAR
ncbi:MAG: hypothetical protein Q7P63_14905 [Verrucomicrobiota bacterium JB022]|nr:hypothetical protein [Verrucomicrobiota bacterium JB022]